MREKELHALIGRVEDGSLSRRAFVQQMVALGVSVPLAGMMLLGSKVPATADDFVYKPTKAGGGGTLKIVQHQATTLLNPHFAVGSADNDGCAIFYEPLAQWNDDGELVPVLAAEIPTRQNGGLAPDGAYVVWKLKQGVKWHDGKPFTADDCLFTAAYASDPATSAYTLATYRKVAVEKINDHTIKVVYRQPTPFWADPFVGRQGLILPKHVFGEYVGVNAQKAPANLMPVGTGPYKLVRFTPGDLILADRNPNYHVSNRPHFDSLEIKGGGEVASAARAVLQTGEYDFAYNLALDEDILNRLEATGVGELRLVGGAFVEHIQLNRADPATDVNGERAHPDTRHFAFTEKPVRKAMNLLVDRASVEKYVYGRSGTATANFINIPEKYRSPSSRWEFSVEKANKILDEAGWVRGSDGIRAKNGRKMQFLYQTSARPQRQNIQSIVKQACAQAGISLELKAVSDSVFFSADPGNPDTFSHFYADMQMYTAPMQEPDPVLYMQQFLSDEVASKANGWQKRNYTRWKSPAYDALYEASTKEFDPVKRAAMFIEMNDLVIEDVVTIPIAYRRIYVGVKKGFKAPLSTWSSYLWRIGDWYRDA